MPQERNVLISKQQIRVLLIEDNPGDARLVEALLAEDGHQAFELICEESLKAGRERVCSESFDVVLLDLNLPDSHGIDTFLELEADIPHVPIVILSGVYDEAITLQAVKEGAQDYMIKGEASGDVIARSLKYAIERKRADATEKKLSKRIEAGLRVGNLAWWEMELPSGSVMFDDRKAEMLGYPPEMFKTYEDFTNLVHPDDHERVMQSMRDHLDGRAASYDVEYRIKTSEGSYKWFRDVGGITEQDEATGYTRVIGIVQEITDRKQAEEEVALKEAQYRGIFEASTDAFLISDMDGLIKEVNPAACIMYGYSYAELTELTGKALIHPDYQNLFEEFVDKASAGETFYADSVEIRKDGSCFDAEVKGCGFEYNGMPHLLAVVRDITERKRAEEALHESERRFKIITENSPDAIFLVDREGNYVYANQAACDMLGYSIDELMRMKITDLSLDIELEKNMEDFKRIIKEGALFTETTLVKKDGSTVPTDLNTIVLPNGLIYGSCRDLTERKQAEERLEASEKRYRELVENAGEAIVVIQDGLIRFSNQEMARISGYEPDELYGRSFTEPIHPDDRDKVIENYRKRFTGEAVPGVYTFRVLSKDGTIKWVAINAVVITWEGRVATLNLMSDITERKQAEDARKESEEKFREIFDNASDVIIYLDRTGKIVDINRRTEEIFGYKPEEVIGKNFTETEFASPDDISRLAQEVSIAVDSGKLKDFFELEAMHKDGHRVWLEASPSLIRRNGEIEGLLVIIRDITERKRAEEGLQNALTESRQRTEEVSSLLEASKAVLGQKSFASAARIIFDSCKVATGATSGYVALLSNDGTENEVLFLDSGGLPCTVDPTLPMPIRGLRAEAYRSGQTVFDNDFHNSEWMQYMPEGHVRLDNVMFAPLTAEGKVVGLLGLANKEGGFTDEDARLGTAFGELASIALRTSLANEERERLLREVQQKSSELEQILYATSHDLRSPLLNIQGFSSELEISLEEIRGLLEGREDVPDEVKTKLAEMMDEDIHDSLQYILTSTSKMDSLLGGLLQLSRLGRKPLEIEGIDMNALMETIASIHKYRLTDGNITLEVEDLPSCRGDRDQIDQVFSNLVDNAMKFLAPDRPGFIRVSGERGEGEVVYCVEDNGVGMAANHQDKIFEIFHQLDPQTSAGEGLGLTIVRRILDRHHGRIWLESEAGKGSRFYVALPE
ncbi:MAG: PAS domain S-box protein [Dehalococcoidia bacterium]